MQLPVLMFFVVPLIAALALVSVGAIAPFNAIRSRRYALPLADMVSHVVGGLTIISLVFTVIFQDAENIVADQRYTGKGVSRALAIMAEVAAQQPSLCLNPSSLDCIEATNFLTKVHVFVGPRGGIGPAFSLYRDFNPNVSGPLKAKFVEYFSVIDADEADQQVALGALLSDFRSYLAVLLFSAFALGCWRRFMTLRIALTPHPSK